ncbi:uncharacterized protein LOC143878347 [Tasmannia lanceolata]|uniref:uncharacterized protein LOC143878347 n=1 Tax=Tasmannia lanceolata TaxID=3420 RepID=UPI0040637F09
MGSLSLRSHGVLLNRCPLSFSTSSSTPILNGRMQRKRDTSMVIYRSSSQTFRVLANANVSPGKRADKTDVIMVDPLEAKRLAAIQMQEIQSKEKFKRQRQIEAINGAWAMIGLTAALVIEGHTGNNILNQLAGYWGSITGFFL